MIKLFEIYVCHLRLTVWLARPDTITTTRKDRYWFCRESSTLRWNKVQIGWTGPREARALFDDDRDHRTTMVEQSARDASMWVDM